MVEFRIFYPIDRVRFDTKWKSNKSNTIEKRTDSYFILPASMNNDNTLNIQYGIKLRNEKKLELKRREKRWSDGQEYWLKTIHSSRSIKFDDLEAIVKQLKKHNETKLVEQFRSSQSIIVCHVHKFRQQIMIDVGCSQELTGLHLEFVRQEDGKSLSDDLFFETACIEKSGIRPIDETIIQRFSQQQMQNYRIIPMGYPEFLFGLSRQINDDK